MSGFHRSARWRSTSLDTRVREWRCRVCGLVPSRPDQLHSAHLVAVSELRRDFPYDGAALTAEQNVVALCRLDHAAFDFCLVGVRDPQLLSPSYRGRLWKRVGRYLPAFVDLLRRRARYRAQLRRESADTLQRAGTQAAVAS